MFRVHRMNQIAGPKKPQLLGDGQARAWIIPNSRHDIMRSFKRTAILDQVVAHRLPGTSTTRWNFHSRAVNTVYEQKENILKCFQTIRDSGDFDPITAREAGGFVRMMEDEAFCFFLTLFHDIMPHADMLFSQLQKRNIDSVYIKGLIKRFTSSIQAIRFFALDFVPRLTVDPDYQDMMRQEFRRVAARVKYTPIAEYFPSKDLDLWSRDGVHLSDSAGMPILVGSIWNAAYMQLVPAEPTPSPVVHRRSPPARRVTPRVIAKGEVAKSPQPDPSKWTVIGQGRKRAFFLWKLDVLQIK
ncbi:hypothetical protein KUCAC02_032135, partial [Chaenocephalus aceratus]